MPKKIIDQYADMDISRGKKWRLRHSVAYRENHREDCRKWRLEHPKEQKEASRKYNLEHPEKQRMRSKLYKVKHPKENKARNQAEFHIPLSLECELCPEDDKRTENLERHHPDYNYPLIIVTVCKERHEEVD